MQQNNHFAFLYFFFLFPYFINIFMSIWLVKKIL